MQRWKIIIVGGDRREVELCRLWQEEGLEVALAGFEKYPSLKKASEADLAQANVLITPLSGIKAPGTVTAVYAASQPLQIMPILKKPAGKYLLLTGSVAPELAPHLPDRAYPVLTADNAELAALNAVPTAEGAIQKAMELSAKTLHGSNVLVVGLGHCGTVLARMLQGLGARVSAAVRRPETAALAETMNIKAFFVDELVDKAGDMDFIFNTAPALLLNEPVLKTLPKSAIILDLASEPGGTDFATAEALGLQALLLPGLPGKAAPYTAAEILSRVYRRLISAKISSLTEGGGR
ncbi:MAG TPA: dipicolinate synthase subunit DpsA [Bacillota bacterium]|nr:dipicolinate synthase subunit DpsA [Bacillota bacterium]